MDFKEVINKVNKNEILLGYNDKNMLKLDIKKNNSIIITGETGTGKSIMLDQVLLELINQNTSLEMNLILIDTSGVELNYYKNLNHTILTAFNDINKSEVILAKILREIERRKNILRLSGVVNVDEYNMMSKSKLPFLVVAIDDDKLLLRNPDMEKMISGIISQIAGLNIMFIMATSDVYNDFFKNDFNILSNTLITFDYTNKEESIYANIDGANNLSIGTFLIKQGKDIIKYHNFEFDDKYIDEIVNK